MRILVAGATGAVGGRVVRELVAAGHSVVGVTRTPAKAEALRTIGVEPAVADGLDRDAIHAAVTNARPDVIVHEMTALSGGDLKRFDQTFALTNRLRTEGLDHLIEAGRRVGTRRFIAQSFCGWPYDRTGAAMKSETDALDPNPPRELRRTLEAIRYLETTVTQAQAFDGLAMRYGPLYGPDTGILDAAFLDQLRRRHVPLIGDGGGWWSFVHVDDAARATALAVDGGTPGIYNIVDDDPAEVREWLPALAAVAGAKPPRHMPAWLARLVAGDHLVSMMTEVRAGSNAKAKHGLGWQPAHASWRQGFAEAFAGSKAQGQQSRAA